MKKNPTTRAVAAALALLGAGSAAALNLNALGSGQALIYPYYTVSGGNQTLFSIVNSTSAGKAVHVRFHEGRNARTALDFSLYLGPYDVWTGAIFSISDTGPDNPAALVTSDTSCTVPRIRGNPTLPMLGSGLRYVPFQSYAYTGSNNDSGPDTLDRTREGYFEVIEMGEVVNRERGSLTALAGSNAPLTNKNCLQIERAWQPLAPAQEGYWHANAMVDMNAPRGGLFGTASIIDALEGTMITYNAAAIDAFSDIVQHFPPGEPVPTLANARTNSTTATANLFSAGTAIVSEYPLSQAIDAVSALFVQDTIYNEFVTTVSVGGASEWVVTLPTKYAYTDEAIVGVTALAPFTRRFPIGGGEGAGTAASYMYLSFWDREQQPPEIPCSPPLPSSHCFLPDDGLDPSLDFAANVIAFDQPQLATQGSRILGSRLVEGLSPGDNISVTQGWMKAAFYSTSAPGGNPIYQQRMRPDRNGGRWDGLPAIGFLATSYTNGQLTPGVLSNYSGLSPHRGSNLYRLPTSP